MKLEEVIKENPQGSFVLWLKNKEECHKTYKILDKLGYQCTIPIKPFKEMWDNACYRFNYQFGVKIKCYSRDCSWNNSIEHWKQYPYDILKYDKDELKYYN